MNELGRFLRARRGAVSPTAVDLPASRGVRRTPGLRREEVALLAGVSADYYTRLERGRETHPSAAVVDALAKALQLTPDEHEHLRGLVAGASRPSATTRRALSRTVRPGVRRLLSALRPNPAYVVGPTNDVLAANPSGLRLLAGLEDWPVRQRNIVRYVFLHPQARTLYTDWAKMAPGVVAHLRAVAGTDPELPELVALVAELRAKSQEFARLWDRYQVGAHTEGSKRLQHPEVGRLTLGFEAMSLNGTDGQRLIAYHAEPGSADYDAIVLLDMAAPSAGHGNEPRELLPADPSR